MKKNIEFLIEQLTLDEKISLLAGADAWHTTAVERLGIPMMKVSDGPVGARGAYPMNGPSSACFPAGVALAATWNPELIEQVGQALGDETRTKGANILLAPTVNIHRSPVAGRNFECYSEDPLLTAKIATAYINGLQSKGVGACIKHFVCNDSEFERQSMSSEVAERPLREIYLRPFELAIRNAHPWAVMSSYNRINGTYASENKILLLDILKDEWGFDGIVISDWYGTYSSDVVQAGLDLEMPGPARWMKHHHVVEAIKNGLITQEFINDKIRRLLNTIDKAGLFEDPQLHLEQSIDNPTHHIIAHHAATEAIVLLKNTNALLPLSQSKIKSIAVIGENARWPSIMGGGSARVTPHYVTSPLQSIQQQVGDTIEVIYAPGCVQHKVPELFDPAWLENGLTLQYFANRYIAGEPVYSQTINSTEVAWFGDKMLHVDPADFSIRATAKFSVPESGVYELDLSGIGWFRMFIDDKLIINHWNDVQIVEDDIPPAEFTTTNCTVDIPLTAHHSYWLTIEYITNPHAPFRVLRAGCMPKLPDDSIQVAATIAAKTDAAIVFGGLNHDWESESFDRPDMDLPGKQAKLIEQVAIANPNTIVVLNAGSPVTMPWLNNVSAVLQAWYLGQETGNAIADILFGNVNPSGKLPTTFPCRLQDNPAYLNYPGENGHVLYGEGVFVGYRYYDKKDITPLFPFGYGLSYTTFAFRNLQLSKPEYNFDEPVQISLEVQNTGTRVGQEVVQVYLRDVQSSLVRPEKELKTFAKLSLKPGQTQIVTLVLTTDDLAYYDPAQKRWVAEPGEFQILIGNSSRDIYLTANFILTTRS